MTGLLPLVPTVTVTVTDEVAEPSLTVIVMVAVRIVDAGTAVIVTVRFAPLPPNTILPLGTALVFEELPLSVREFTPFGSATVRFIVPPELVQAPPDATIIVGGTFVGVAVGVFVGVSVGVLVGVFVGGTGVLVGVLVGVMVGVSVGTRVFVGVLLGVLVGILVAVGVGPLRFSPITTGS